MANQHWTFTEKGREIAEKIVQTINDSGGKARLDVTWWDYGGGITWETIIAYSPSINRTYQLLYPVDFEKMNRGELTQEEFNEIIDRALEKIDK